MKQQHTILIGKTIKRLAALRGGGSALPGLVVEKLDPAFMSRALDQLEHGVIVVSGTNGKTTTTKMVVELLKSRGLKVFTNRTGSNFTRGVVAALLESVTADGSLPYDVAVLELDEAHAVHFVRHHRPTYVLLLNVMRDQLDRFGEIDHTARLLQKVARSAAKGVVLNRDDPRVAAIAPSLDASVEVRYFGADSSLHRLFVSDDDFHATKSGAETTAARGWRPKKGDVMLKTFKGQTVTYAADGALHTVDLHVEGVYNFLNAAGAVCLAGLVTGSKPAEMIPPLRDITPAFGRGESFTLPDGSRLHLILVKNPAGFRLALSTVNPTDETATMIAINDQYADGRDMSWLWDVDFEIFKDSGVQAVSGIRAYDMALRLQYDEVTVGLVEPDLKKALAAFVTGTRAQEKRIYCTYTAMLQLRRHLAQYAEVAKI